jgi:hypothetical protein
MELLGSWGLLYKMGLSASNCREDENIVLHPCKKKNPYPPDVS